MKVKRMRVHVLVCQPASGHGYTGFLVNRSVSGSLIPNKSLKILQRFSSCPALDSLRRVPKSLERTDLSVQASEQGDVLG